MSINIQLQQLHKLNLNTTLARCTPRYVDGQGATKSFRTPVFDGGMSSVNCGLSLSPDNQIVA